MLSQEVMDQLAMQASAMYGSTMETVQYHARSQPTDTVVIHERQAKCRVYRANELTTEAITHTDQECRIPTAVVNWQPSHFDQIVRADGTTWLVQSWQSGLGHPWWKFQIRQVA